MCRSVLTFCAALLLCVGVVRADELQVLRDGASGRQFALRVTPPIASPRTMAVRPATEVLHATADAFITANLEAIGIADPAQELTAEPAKTDKLGLSHVRYVQKWHGLDVLGCEVVVHLDRAGQVTYVKTTVARDLPAVTTPLMVETAAQDAGLRAGGSKFANALTISRSRLLILPLGIIRNDSASKNCLAWEVVVTDAESHGDHFATTYYYDARSGALLLEESGFRQVYVQVDDCMAENGDVDRINGHAWNSACFNVYPIACGADTDLVSPRFPPYVFGRTQGRPPRGPYPNPSPSPLNCGIYGHSDVDSAYSLLEAVHAYYLTNFGINGANRHGGTGRGATDPRYTRALVHVGTSTCISPATPCGVWAGMYNSTGGSIAIWPRYATADLVGHEYSHAVVCENGRGGACRSDGPSISVDEGTSEFMGEMLEYARYGVCDWSSVKPGSIQNPFNNYRPYPDRWHSVDTYCAIGTGEWGYTNMTIFSHALYLISEGGEFNGCDIQGQGKDVAQQILFRGWDIYFSYYVDFNEAYADLIQACNDLYPASVTAEVTKALQAVELDQPGRCSGIPERAPASAVNHAGSAVTTRFDATPDTTFGVGQDLWLQFGSASPNRTLDFQLLPRNSTRPIWQETTPLALATGSGTVLSDSTLFVRFGALMTEGSYDLLVDGNRDGHYQPWADVVLPITVMASTGVGGASLPAVTALQAIQPNPMRQRTQIAFSLAHPSQVALRVYDLAGRRVRTIASERLPAGTHVRGWDGRDDQGAQTGAGVYFVKLLAGTAADSRTLVRTQ